LDPGFISPVISTVDADGTAEISFDPGASIGETEVVVTVSAENAQTVTDTFLVKTLEKVAENANSVAVDLSKRFQTMHGFGTYMNEYFDLYTQEMGATAMRVGIISNQIEPINDNYDPNVLNREGLDYSAFNWDAMRKMKEMGVETFILTSWSAPNWMKDNHDESWYRGNVIPWEEARNRTSPIYYDEWAEYFVAAYRMFEEEAGIKSDKYIVEDNFTSTL
jgi:O-glycosyl hydrolase